MRFRNFYKCPCGYEWVDEWSATCDDRCPQCDPSCSHEDEEQEWKPCGDPRPKAFIPPADGFRAVMHQHAPQFTAIEAPVALYPDHMEKEKNLAQRLQELPYSRLRGRDEKRPHKKEEKQPSLFEEKP